VEQAPGRRGLDAGCGAGARDVFHSYSDGYDVIGVDAIEETSRQPWGCTWRLRTACS
jgi:hypothetical protein